MKHSRFLPLILSGLALSWAGSAFAYKPGVLRELADAVETAAPVPVPAAGSIEVGFSPKGGAEALVLRVIGSAKFDIKALSYSFTSPRVVSALLRASKRGVTVSLVTDYRNNITDARSGKARAALSALAEAGCDVGGPRRNRRKFRHHSRSPVQSSSTRRRTALRDDQARSRYLERALGGAVDACI